MKKLLVLHTNHGGGRFDETDIPQILHDAYEVSTLDLPDEDQLDFIHIDTDTWPDNLKMSLMYAAQLSWYPDEGPEPSFWSNTESGVQAANQLFAQYDGLAQAISGDQEPLLRRWRTHSTE